MGIKKIRPKRGFKFRIVAYDPSLREIDHWDLSDLDIALDGARALIEDPKNSIAKIDIYDRHGVLIKSI